MGRELRGNGGESEKKREEGSQRNGQLGAGRWDREEERELGGIEGNGGR